MKIVQHSQTSNTILTDKLDELNKDLPALVRLVEHLTGFGFHETRAGAEYRATHSGLRVSLPNGYNVPKFFDESCKTTYTNADGYTFKKLFYLHTDGKEYGQKVDLLYTLGFVGLAECSQMLPNYTPKQTPTHTPIQIQTVAKPAKAANTTWEYITTGWNTQHGRVTLEHLQAKTGAGAKLLARYVVPICRKVGRDETGAVKYQYDSTGVNFMYGFTDGRGLVRIAQPNQSKAKRLGAGALGVYRFGFDQLPKDGTGLTCVICAGETDAICINACGNAYGFYAICFNSEKKEFDQPTLDELRGRGFGLIAFYDNDNAGRTNIVKHAPLARVTYVDTNLLWQYWNLPNVDTCKDICHLYAFGGFSTVVGALEFAKLTNGRWERDAQNPYSVAIPHGYNVPIWQYLGENTETQYGNLYFNPTRFLELAMCQNNKLSIISQAGTGKTTLFQTLFGRDNILQAHGKDYYVLLVPTTTIAEQQYQEFINVFGVNAVQLIKGGEKNTNALDAGANIIISVYDSFPRLCGIGTGKTKHIADILHRCYIVLDEYHLLLNAYDYRNTVSFRYIQNYVVENPNVPVCTMTGTPVLYANVARTYNQDGTHTDTHLFKHAFCTPQIQNKIKCTIITHDLKRAAFAGWVEDTTPANTVGTTLVKWDNKGYNDINTARLAERNILAVSLNSDNKDEKGAAKKCYDEICNTGKFSEPYEYLYFTKLLELGVSIKNQIARVVLLETTNFREIIQLANRPRMQQDGTNAVVNLDILLKEKSTDTDANAVLITDVLDEIAARTQHALEYAKHCEKFEKRITTGKLGRSGSLANMHVTTDEKNRIVEELDGFGNAKHYVDTLGILLDILQIENSNVTPEILQTRLKMDTRFEFMPIVTGAAFEEDLAAKAELDSLKEEKEKHLERFDALLLDANTNKQLLECVAFLCKSPELKEQIRDTFHLPKWSMDTNKDFLELELDAIRAKGSQYKISKAIQIMKTGLDKDKAFAAVATATKTEIYNKLESLAWNAKKKQVKGAKAKAVQLGTPVITDANGVTANTFLQTERVNDCYKFGVMQFIKNIAKGQIKNEFTAQRVLDIANKALEKANQTNGTKYKPFPKEKEVLTMLNLSYNLLEPKRVWDGKKRGARLYGFDLENLKKTH